MEEIEVKRLAMGSVFKILMIGSVCSLIPFCLLIGVLGLFGASTISWNDRPLTGLSGLMASPFIGGFIALLFAGVFGLFVSAGLWLYSRFRPLTLHYRKRAHAAS